LHYHFDNYVGKLFEHTTKLNIRWRFR